MPTRRHVKVVVRLEAEGKRQLASQTTLTHSNQLGNIANTGVRPVGEQRVAPTRGVARRR